MKQVLPFLVLLLVLYFLLRTDMLREIKDNNPMGVKDFGINNWKGQIGVDDKGFPIFDTSINGIRAGCINLIHKQTRHNALTLKEVFNGYTTDYSDTNKYANQILSYLQKNGQTIFTSIDQYIDVKFNLELLCRGVIRNELTVNPYSDVTIQTGVSLALLEA